MVRRFSSGQDLNDRTVQAGKVAVDLGHTLETEWNPLVNSIRESKKIIIGAINGVAAGAGLSVALACDLITSRPGVKFVSGFSALGLAPDAGSTFTFLKAFGYQKTLEFFLFNNPLYSEDLEKNGMINYIGDDYMDKQASTWANQIAGMAPLSLELMKKNLKLAMDSTFAESMQNETDTQRFLGNSSDYQEGLKAFFEKENPNLKDNNMELNKVVIVGAGTMGQGIAQWFVQQGVQTEIADINEKHVHSAIENMSKSWDKLKAKGKFTDKEVKDFNNNIQRGDIIGIYKMPT